MSHIMRRVKLGKLTSMLQKTSRATREQIRSQVIGSALFHTSLLLCCTLLLIVAPQMTTDCRRTRIFSPLCREVLACTLPWS